VGQRVCVRDERDGFRVRRRAGPRRDERPRRRGRRTTARRGTRTAGARGGVVYYDPEADLAVVAVDGLEAEPLDVAPSLSTGDPAVVQGYPYGGPFTSTAAEVLDAGPVQIPAADGSGGAERDIYALAATIHLGNSGGPVLSTDGDVVGVIFGSSASGDDVAYGVTTTELMPVIAQAADLDAAVAPGRCAG
jgi:S1-C subfamily serine protease